MRVLVLIGGVLVPVDEAWLIEQGLMRAGWYVQNGAIFVKGWLWNSRLPDDELEALGRAVAQRVADMICFTAGTEVLTEDGAVAIERIDVGDRVLTRETEPDASKSTLNRLASLQTRLSGSERLGLPAQTAFQAWRPSLTCKILTACLWAFVGLVAPAAHAEGLTPAALTSPAALEIRPDDWRVLNLALPTTDGSGDVISMRALRSMDWIAQRGARVGGEIFVGLPELGVYGFAVVQSIEPCPPIEPGRGRLVLTTLNHLNGYVLRISFEDCSQPLESTRTHPFWSLDRAAWIDAGELKPGERLLSHSGPVRVLRLDPLPGIHRVYNLEVQGENEFFAGAAHILSHNTAENPCGLGAIPAWVRDGNSLVSWAREHLERSRRVLTHEEADRFVALLRQHGVAFRADPGHPNTPWTGRHINVGHKGQVHVNVPEDWQPK